MGGERVVVLGASGNALDILDIIDALGEPWQAVGVLDDVRRKGSWFSRLPVLGLLAEANSLANVGFINGIASDRSHRRKLSIIAGTGIEDERFVKLIHPLASVSRRANVGPGSCIGPGCAVSGHVEIGAHVWLGSHAVVGHDCVLHAGATVAPAATLGGGVKVGSQAYIGSGAILRPGITVGDGALIGMGAVVLKDVPPGFVVVGNPGRRLAQASARGETMRPIGHGRMGDAVGGSLRQD